MDIDSNIGYDFDVNIRVNDENEDYNPQIFKFLLKMIPKRIMVFSIPLAKYKQI